MPEVAAALACALPARALRRPDVSKLVRIERCEHLAHFLAVGLDRSHRERGAVAREDPSGRAIHHDELEIDARAALRHDADDEARHAIGAPIMATPLMKSASASSAASRAKRARGGLTVNIVGLGCGLS